VLSLFLLAASACSAPEQRALDFFLGTWRVTNAQGQLMGHSRYALRAQGCALLEEWYGARGGRSIALVYYDTANQRWLRQNIAAGFREVDFPGQAISNGARFSGPVTGGKHLRVTWTLESDGSLALTDEVSSDQGATFTLDARTRSVKVDRLPDPLPPGPSIHPACADPGFREFDSWITNSSRLQSAARGCVLIETDPASDAVALLFYDPEIKAWRRRSSPR
jgi:hypothetical protein